jgi:hypothetical protein
LSTDHALLCPQPIEIHSVRTSGWPGRLPTGSVRGADGRKRPGGDRRDGEWHGANDMPANDMAASDMVASDAAGAGLDTGMGSTNPGERDAVSAKAGRPP